MPTTDPSVVEQLAALDEERVAIEAAEYADPARAAEDVAAWHRRRGDRANRLVEIEQKARDLQEWGELVETHREDVTQFLAVARPFASEFRYALANRHYEQDRRPQNPRARLVSYLDALTKFSRAVAPHDAENTRRILTREIEQWFRSRDAVTSAELVYNTNISRMPAPELADGGLPDWVRWGAHRLDRNGVRTDAG